MIRILSLLLLLNLFCSCQTSNIQPPTEAEYTDAIRLNQVGYYPIAPKKAVVANTLPVEGFQVFDLKNMKKVYEGKLRPATKWPLAGETVYSADFSTLQKPGRYTLFVKDVGYSFPFEVKPNVMQEALTAGMKSYYYHRASIALDPAHAGQWHRPAGHPDDEVIFHPSSGREGTTDAKGGWYDAGDYGKYTVNGAFSLGQMLFLYEQYPNVLQDGTLNIPESGNGISDLLDELKYEMDWLLSMQDEDGGAFHKLTAKKFSGMKLPHEVNLPRFIIGKGTAASLDLAAVAAKMSRAFRDIDATYAEKCLDAAKKAWAWAVVHPGVNFQNPEDVKTGAYPDANFSGEFFWAAAELYVSTNEKQYLPYLEKYISNFRFVEGESWANFPHHLGAFTLVEYAKDLTATATTKKAILAAAEELLTTIATNDYFQPVDDFQWGSNSDVLCAAMILAQAYRIDPKSSYLAATQETTDYIFGKNATGYCFLTGFGSKSPMFIHHRPSAGDDIEAPVPGFLSGGPNSRKQDASQVHYPENAPPMKCWMDVQPSYASNEVCVNWNSALIYVLGFLEMERMAK